MIGFVQQSIPMSDGVTLEVLAQITDCEYLVITPTFGRNKAGARELSGGLSLTHTLTGRAIAHQEYPNKLTDLAKLLAKFDWNFTDPDYFKKPESAEMRDGIRDAYREWRLDDAYQGPVHYASDSDEVKAAREKDPAGTLLGEHLEWWMKHSKAMWSKDEPNFPTLETNPQAWHAQVEVSVQSYGLIYLLAVLRAIDPRTADTAARDLVKQFDHGDTLGEWIWQWHDELVAGKPLTLHGIPDGDPLAEFATVTSNG